MTMKKEIICFLTCILIGCVAATANNNNDAQRQTKSDVLQDLPLFNDELEKLRIERSLKKDTKKSKLRKRERKRKLSVAAVERVVRETLQQEIQPVAVALQMIQVDSFSKGIIRQLSNLEKIQSKVLTEYGELRAAIGEIGRHTMDLGRHLAALDERLASLDRQLPHRMNINMRNRDPNKYSISSINLAEDVASLSLKLSSTERLVTDSFDKLENRTLDSIKLSKTVLERRISVSDMEMNKLFRSLETTINKGMCMPSSANSVKFGKVPMTEYAFRKSANGFAIPKIGSDGEDLIYSTSDERIITNSDHLERNERQHPPSITPFTSWPRPKTDYENSVSHGGASRLASEIAKYLRTEDYSIPARDCSDLASVGQRENGIYNIYPSSCTKRYVVKVFCNMENIGGGWTVIQRRGPPLSLRTGSYGDMPFAGFSPVDFFRGWSDYKWGFGNLNGEYWLGNEYIHQLTQSGDYKLRIELEDWTGEKRWAEYMHFSLGSESQNYSLHFGDYSGNAGNSLKQHNGAGFSTRDRDNDSNPRGECAQTFHGAWWFNSCHDSHLNGKYHTDRQNTYGDGINWLSFKGHSYSLKRTTMMITPGRKVN